MNEIDRERRERRREVERVNVKLEFPLRRSQVYASFNAMNLFP